MEWDKITEEGSKILKDLIKIDTTNPPGQERKAAEYLAEILVREGIEPEIIEKESGRGNIVAKLKGEKDEPPLLLLSHLDVVPVEKDKWKVDPFSAEEKDGFIWGRGAVDCKNLVTQELMTLLLLKRQNIKLKRDLIFAATADEEKGGTAGLKYLVEDHWDKIKAKYALNEGGGLGVKLFKHHLYFCATAEKGLCWLKLKVRGSAGHGSLPTKDNAIIHMSKALTKISNYHFPMIITPTTDMMIKELGKALNLPLSFLKPLFRTFLPFLILSRLKDSGLKTMIEAILRNTITPTVLRGGYKTNIIPSECEAEIDGRIVPGENPENLIKILKNLLKNYPLDIEPIETFLPTESTLDTELYQIIKEAVGTYDEKGKVLPFMLTGATDSRFLREKGVVAYGFSPLLLDIPEEEYLKIIHGHNERISLNNLSLGLKIIYKIALKFCSL